MKRRCIQTALLSAGCMTCGKRTIVMHCPEIIAGRATYYCPNCCPACHAKDERLAVEAAEPGGPA